MGKCGFIKASGDACKALPMKGEGWCYVHHPDNMEKRRRDGSKGGKRGGRARPLGDLSRIQTRLEEMAGQVLDGELDRADAAVAGQLLNYAIGALRTGLKAREVLEFEERLAEIEEIMERNKEGGQWGTRIG